LHTESAGRKALSHLAPTVAHKSAPPSKRNKLITHGDCMIQLTYSANPEETEMVEIKFSATAIDLCVETSNWNPFNKPTIYWDKEGSKEMKQSFCFSDLSQGSQLYIRPSRGKSFFTLYFSKLKI